MPRRITLADIAKVAGYHPTTVSMALRNHPRLPKATIDKIKSVAEELGYRPDPALGALVAYRSNASRREHSTPLAYLTYWDNEWGWKNSLAHMRFYEGAVARADRLGYRIDHFWLGSPTLSHKRINEILNARGIRGLIVASHIPSSDNLAALDWDSFSCVKIDFYPVSLPFHTISNDQRSIIQLAFDKAIAAGYRRIGFVMPRWWDDYVNKAWSAGYLASLENVPDSERLPIKTFTTASRMIPGIGPSEFESWLKAARPDAVISYAPFIENAVKTLGLRIPDDFAFIDICLETEDGSLAGVRNNCFRVGELAVEILGGQLQQNQIGFPEFPTVTKVAGTWLVGESLPHKAAARA